MISTAVAPVPESCHTSSCCRTTARTNNSTTDETHHDRHQ